MRPIDADALIVALKRKAPISDSMRVMWAECLQEVRFAPTIEPEPQWIPCRETVDIPDHEILACNKYGEEMFGYLSYEDDQWLCESDGYMMYDPIAWREKSEPYRGGR